MKNLVPIGRFSRVCRLSIKALRYYDELGLLRPAAVDPDSGYRYYSLAQAVEAEVIQVLRSLDVPLEDVRQLLREREPAAIRKRLELHRLRVEERIAEERRI
ncbi:MAG TPA: helix-turn-helix domain-containing protein, partial [Anaerolineales bacterium]|nr:helix-turn-helix domain-containing protein [Anaerolineales bacterium]